MNLQRPPQTLSDSDVATYRRDGFVIVPGFLDPTTLADVERWTREVEAAPEKPGDLMKYYDDLAADAGRRILSRIEYLRARHEGFRDLVSGEVLSTPVGQLFGEPAVLFKDKINFKLPGTAGFDAHQDIQAGWDRYCPTHLSVLISIDATTVENGCLELAPRRPDRGLIGRAWTPLEGAELAGLEFRAYPTEPGDACFFDSYVPHRSAPNRTAQPRRVLYLTYNPASQGDHYERYFADKRASFPPDIERAPGTSYRYRV